MAMRDGWTETTLGEIAEVNMGQSPPGDTYNSDGNGLPFMQGSAEFGDRFPNPVKWCTAPVKVANPGDLLLSVRAPVGDSNIANQRIAIGRGLACIRGTAQVTTEYLALAIQTKTADLLATSGTGMFASITSKNLKGLCLCLPSLEEQRRIVDVVASVDAYIDALKDKVAKARTARNAVLHELLSAGGPDWTETTLGEVLEIVRGGSPRPIQNYLTDSPDGINWVKIGDASNQTKFIWSTQERIRPEGLTRSRLVHSGDFLLSNSMSFGRPYIMRTTGCIHDGWLLLSGIDRTFDEDFFYNVLTSDFVQIQFRSLAAGSGVKNLNIDSVRSVVVPVPPRSTQRQVGELMNLMDDVIVVSEKAVAGAVRLRSGLLSDLLSGEHEIPASYDSLLGAA